MRLRADIVTKSTVEVHTLLEPVYNSVFDGYTILFLI